MTPTQSPTHQTSTVAPEHDKTRHAIFRLRLSDFTHGLPSAWLMPDRHSTIQIAAEAVGLSILGIAAFAALAPTDPLFLRAGFPWPWLLPVFVALRYGTIAGALCGATLLATWPVVYGAGVQAFPSGIFAGGFAVVLISGQFADAWARRLGQARTSNEYLSQRLSILTNSHFLLKRSHESLEQDLLVRPATLRGSLAQLRDVALSAATPPPREQGSMALPGAQCFLETVAQSCQIESAALYVIRDEKLGTQPVASIGLLFDLDSTDPLIVHALATNQLTHVRATDFDTDAGTRYIACAPLIAAGKEVAGMLIVRQMPFLALTRSNLEFLFALCGYYANGTRHAELTRDLLLELPGCPRDFALEYARLASLRHRSRIESSLAILVFESPKPMQAVLDYVLQTEHAFCPYWLIGTEDEEDSCVMTLIMPLLRDKDAPNALKQLERGIKSEVKFDSKEGGFSGHCLPIDGNANALRRFLVRCDVVA
ncbi:MAG TPA: PelD GGDEF domain-containing protein [Trinickia sp.]|uniref:PelD GGDEF domain-containing protein n=1 Tax=Trinickia sp. TaxID=2571163 RepID=UPI002C2DCFBC|nr:PelD GGDEF domain-containing protein [Trinickia sp.]HTI17302.1 PelD GGDEF domain-containing protein [Trinickia sp.]